VEGSAGLDAVEKFGDPLPEATLDAIRPAVLTSPASVLALFGVPIGDAPAWVRPVQLGAALALGALAVLRGRWAAVLLVGIAMRVALDPQVFLYYSAGLLLAALAWDLLQSPHPLPVWTLAGFVALDVVYVEVGSDTTRAVFRLTLTVAAVGIALLPLRKLAASATDGSEQAEDAPKGPAAPGPSDV